MELPGWIIIICLEIYLIWSALLNSRKRNIRYTTTLLKKRACSKLGGFTASPITTLPPVWVHSYSAVSKLGSGNLPQNKLYLPRKNLFWTHASVDQKACRDKKHERYRLVKRQVLNKEARSQREIQTRACVLAVANRSNCWQVCRAGFASSKSRRELL